MNPAAAVGLIAFAFAVAGLGIEIIGFVKNKTWLVIGGAVIGLGGVVGSLWLGGLLA